MAMDVKKASINFGDVGGDNRKLLLLKAPSDAEGGGLTILSARAHSSTTLALSAGVGGTTFTLALHKYGTGGTPTVNGTVSDVLGGTAVGWTAGVVVPFSLTAPYTFLDAGESLFVQYNEVNAGNPVWCQVDVTYVLGRG